MRARQGGLSLIGFIIVGAFVALVVVLGAKVVPAYIEYYTILRNVKQVAASGDLRGATVKDVRNAFDKRMVIDYAGEITGKDLDVTKENNEIVISFAYSKVIPMIGNASLLLEFEGSSRGSTASAGD